MRAVGTTFSTPFANDLFPSGSVFQLEGSLIPLKRYLGGAGTGGPEGVLV